MKKKLAKFLLYSALASSIIININIFNNNYQHLFFALWIITIIFFCASTGLVKKIESIKLPKLDISVAIVIISALVVRIINYDLNRIHGDDLMTAFFADNLNLSRLNPFAGIPIPATEWEAQFAPPFFILQKIFFVIFGANLLTIKLSILPYILIAVLMIYLITELFLGKKTARIAVFLYAFLAFNIYIETVGLWVVSGSAVFLVFFYCLSKYIKSNSPRFASLTGLTCGFCYLFYFSGYAALPTMLVVFLFKIISQRKLSVFYQLLYAVIGFLIVLSPFATYAVKFNNYFTQRASQMSLINQEQSLRDNKQNFYLIRDNLLLTLRSIYQHDIGGHGGVNFGNLALLDRFSLFLFLIGVFISLFLLLRNYYLLLFYFVIILSFIPIVLSIPPPAYHRMLLVLPFVNIISAIPFYYLFSLKMIRPFLKYSAIFIFLILYAATNLTYFQAAIEKEKYNTTLRISEYINRNYPNRVVHCAAYPGYAFDKIYYFSRGKNAQKVDVEYHATYLKNFNMNEKYVYVITLPMEFDDDFIAADSKGKLIKFSEDYSLFVN